jgi:hypothetical protein
MTPLSRYSGPTIHRSYSDTEPDLMRPEPGTTAEFFFDQAHGRKEARISLWIIANDKPLSVKSIRLAMAALGIDDLQMRNSHEIFGIVKELRDQGVKP